MESRAELRSTLGGKNTWEWVRAGSYLCLAPQANRLKAQIQALRLLSRSNLDPFWFTVLFSTPQSRSAQLCPQGVAVRDGLGYWETGSRQTLAC